MFFAPPTVNDAAAYIESRRHPIADRLAGAHSPEPLADPAGEVLADLAGAQLDFAIISVDLVGSTKLATTLPPSEYSRLIDTLTAELSAIAPLFRGHVLKYTGDGLIAFISGPSSNTQNDLALECALTMHELVYQALNPELQRVGLPEVDVRIGIDAGEAAVLILGSPATKRHADIIGEVVSLACKVEATGAAATISVGGVAARSMHSQWRQLFERARTPPGWPYTDEDGRPYEIYRVRQPGVVARARRRTPAEAAGRLDSVDVREHGLVTDAEHRLEAK
jgi:class 3 adenylate cyclase